MAALALVDSSSAVSKTCLHLPLVQESVGYSSNLDLLLAGSFLRLALLHGEHRGENQSR